MDKLENSYGQVRLFAKMEEDEEFQQIVYVKYKFEEFFYLLDVMSSVDDTIIANQPICNVLKK